jgi:SNF2 family DNA or RNA helicase
MRTYGDLLFNKTNDRWEIGKCEPHVALRLKKIFPKISITSLPPYYFSNENDICADLDWFIQRYPLKINDLDKKLLNNNKKSFLKTQADLERILVPNWSPNRVVGLREGSELRHYQAQAVALYEKVKRLLLVDDIGLGKTYEAIGAALIPGVLPVAIVVQTHLPNQWEEKIKEFSHLRVHKIKKTTPYNLPEADVYLYKYSQISGWVNYFAEGHFKMAIFDEIQELRRGLESNKGLGARVLVNSVEYVLGITATPVFNYGIEMFNIMEFIKPKILGTQKEFIREWCKGDTRIVSEPEALGSYLRENHAMLRRRKEDVYDEVNKVNTIIQTIGYDEKAVKNAEELAKKLAVATLSGSFTERGQAARQLDIHARQTTGVSKAKYVAEFIRVLVASGEPVLLAGWHHDYYDILKRELKDLNPVMYTGKETDKQKEQAKQSFLSGDSKVLILSLRSGAGMDGLQHVCSTVVIGELDWSPKVHEQFIGRVDRDGQTKPIMAIYLVSEYGSDPVIIDILGLKNSQSSGMLNPEGKPEKIHSDKSKLAVLAEQYLSKKEIQKIKENNIAVKV